MPRGKAAAKGAASEQSCQIDERNTRSGKRQSNGLGDQLVTAASVVLLSTTVGLAVRLWRQLHKTSEDKGKLQGQLQAQNKKLEAVLALLSHTRHEMDSNASDLKEARRLLEVKLEDLQQTRSQLLLTKSQMDMVNSELVVTKRHLREMQRDLDARNFQIRSLQSGTDYESEYGGAYGW